MPIYREIECSSYEEVKITMEEIAGDINEKETTELIKLLIKKFPNVVNNVFIKENKLFPESQKTELIRKYQSENKSINEYNKS